MAGWLPRNSMKTYEHVLGVEFVLSPLPCSTISVYCDGYLILHLGNGLLISCRSICCHGRNYKVGFDDTLKLKARQTDRARWILE